MLMLATGFALWRFAAGELPVDMVRDRLIGVIERATGDRANVALKAASIRQTDDGPRLVLDGFALEDASGRSVVGAPRAEIAFDLWTLLVGGAAMRRVELYDVEVRLSVDSEGRVALSSRHAAGETAATTTDWRGLLASVEAVLSGRDSSAIAGLDRFALRNGTLSIDDQKTGAKLRYDDITIDLDTAGSGRRLSLAARGASRAWSVVAQPDAGSAHAFTLDLSGVPLADAGAFLRLPIASSGGGGALSGRISLTADEDGAPQTLTAKLSSQGGRMTVAPGERYETVVTGLGLDASWDAASRMIAVSRASIATTAAELAIAGAMTHHMNGSWEIDLASGSGSARPIHAGGQRAVIDHISGRAAWLADGAVNVPSWSIGGKDYEIRGEARIAAPADGGAVSATLSASPMDLLTVLALWPAGVAEDARIYMARTALAGRLDRLAVRLDLDAATRAAFIENRQPPREVLSVQASVSRARYAPLDDLPPLDVDAAEARIDGRDLIVTAPAASLETPAKTRVALSDVVFKSDYTNGAGPSRVDFHIKGSAESAFDLLETPLLKKVAGVDDEIDVTKGAADIRVDLAFPINVPIDVSDVVATINGSFTGMAVEGAALGDPITDIRAGFSFERGAFSMKGDGRMTGAPTSIDIRRGAKGEGDATLSIMMDDAARARRGLPSAPSLAGPTPVKIVRAFGQAKSSATRVDIDLARAAINGAVPGWVKPAGKPGRISFAYAKAAKSSDFELQDFSAESAGFMLKGIVTLGPNNALKSARFTQARMSQGDEARIDWERAGSTVKVVVRGANIDARPFIKAIYEPSKESSAETSETDLDLKSAIFTGHNGEAATNVEIRVVKRGSDLRQFTMSGRFGKADLRGLLARRPGGPPRMLIESADAGAFLRFIDLYRRMVGGHLTIDVGVDEARQDGQLVVKDFILRNEPALRQVSPPATAPVNAQSTDTSALSRAPTRAAARGDVEFEKVRVDFVRSAGRLDIKDGVMWGPVLGVQFEGIVDGPRDRIEVTGSYVPAYALNNAFAQLPVVGLILGGGQYGGLFGVNFKVTGAFSQPSVVINPLSALTPGVFRRFLEFNKQSVEGRAPRPPRDLGAARP
ncbi:MAG: hypothetical protein BGP06_05580 [Rhizobiales bacterium 65-9]|nr:hypothetical protein [Hyphomicrobiales bacterium]OJY35342.1 MAG: hypothetical protein BGP06_05580 [Rhizobiales bacterium 65-9]